MVKKKPVTTRHPATATMGQTEPEPYKPDTTAKPEGHEPFVEVNALTQASPARLLWGRMRKDLADAGKLIGPEPDKGIGSFEWFERLYNDGRVS